MSTDDNDSEEGFLARWSRLKQEQAPEPPAEPQKPAAPTGQVAAPPAEKKEPVKPIDPATLPSIDSLTTDSDFTAFLREGVPEDLRRQALRKLWVCDPVVAATDVFDVYNLDYFNMPSFPDGVKTLFRVGHGMLDAIEEQAEKEAVAKAAAEAPAKPAAAESEASPESDKTDVALQQPEDAAPSETPEKTTES
jgi:hypothetical protein